MRPTFANFSKAKRWPMTSKQGNKDYYKGTRQAFVPGVRTGAPGEYFGKSKSLYRLVDEKVRYFVAPPVVDLANSPMKPYVQRGTHLSKQEMDMLPFGKIPQGGLTGEHYLKSVQTSKVEGLEQQSVMEASAADAVSLAVAA